jgi:hypothetical protein
LLRAPATTLRRAPGLTRLPPADCKPQKQKGSKETVNEYVHKHMRANSRMAKEEKAFFRTKQEKNKKRKNSE